MTELKRWLGKEGCSFKAGKSSHLHIFLGQSQSVMPFHCKKEMKKGLVEKIKKDLDLK
jgi:mRNA interferase HicA